MFIVWGTKRKERKQGRVADFCPVCRDVRAFELVRVGLASHVYYISFGQGKLAGYLIQCTTCGVKLSSKPERYTGSDQDPFTDLPSLVRNTFPTIKTAHASRLALEEKVKQTLSSITADERLALLMEPFQLLNPQVEARCANSTQLDKPAGIGCLGTVLVGGGLFFGSLAVKGKAQDQVLIVAAVLFGIGTIYTFIQMHLGPKRFFRAKILPVLVKSLKPLRPTRDELAGCIDRSKKLGLRIGKMAKVDEIWPPLERLLAGFDN